jgi:hypothetical protein
MNEPKLLPVAKRKTPTERQHEALIAALTRSPVKASEGVEVSRDAKGYRYNVAGVVGEAETLEACASRVLDVAIELDAKLTFHAAEPEVEVARNAKGDAQFSVKGDPVQALAHADALDTKYPLSRKQSFDRNYLANEK